MMLVDGYGKRRNWTQARLAYYAACRNLRFAKHLGFGQKKIEKSGSDIPVEAVSGR